MHGGKRYYGVMALLTTNLNLLHDTATWIATLTMTGLYDVIVT